MYVCMYVCIYIYIYIYIHTYINTTYNPTTYYALVEIAVVVIRVRATYTLASNTVTVKLIVAAAA